MKITLERILLVKRRPLTISRGTSASSENLIVTVEQDGIVGIGEMAPVDIGDGREDAEYAERQLTETAPDLEYIQPWEMQRVERVLADHIVCKSAQAALDFALHDWLGKKSGMPLYRLLGADPVSIVPTSLTIGINPPDVARDHAAEILSRLEPQSLKVKLGSSDGIEADKEMLQAVMSVTPPNVKIRVDANGGWSVNDALKMLPWLAEWCVEYVEQPLPIGHEGELSALYLDSPIPIFADESCRTADDIWKLKDRVHGVNLKLMKCGGIREGLRLIHTARSAGLKVMMGCMSETSLSIAAGAHLSPLVDYLDLDSHLNLNPDPFVGLQWSDGRVMVGDANGLGINWANRTE
ncbi:MAG: dipeptide epimerase [Chthonomonadales bacterium]